MSVGRSGLAASMAWEMIIHSQPWVHMVEKSSGLMALHADNDKMPLDMVFRVGSKVEQPWLTALQKAAECELEQLKNRSWPLHGARALPLLATKSLLAASCVFLVCGSWLTSKATLSLILAMDSGTFVVHIVAIEHYACLVAGMAKNLVGAFCALPSHSILEQCFLQLAPLGIDGEGAGLYFLDFSLESLVPGCGKW